MSNAPYLYDYANANAKTSAVQPNTVHVRESGLSQFFQRSLLQKAMGVFKFTLPENWPVNYFLYTLFCNGYIAVVETDKFGVIPQICTLSGYDVFYQPTKAMISNPLIRNTLTPRIGESCTIIKLQPDYCGIMDTVTYYADTLALAAQTLGVNLLNSKLSYVFVASNKAGAETAKRLYDDIASGRPAVVLDNLVTRQGTTWELFEQHVKQNFIVPELVEVMNSLENRFCTEVGLPNANTQKKERMIVDEVNANNFETESRARLWLDELKKGCEETNRMFGTSLNVEFRKDGDNCVRQSVNFGPVSV